MCACVDVNKILGEVNQQAALIDSGENVERVDERETETGDREKAGGKVVSDSEREREEGGASVSGRDNREEQSVDASGVQKEGGVGGSDGGEGGQQVVAIGSCGGEASGKAISGSGGDREREEGGASVSGRDNQEEQGVEGAGGEQGLEGAGGEKEIEEKRAATSRWKMLLESMAQDMDDNLVETKGNVRDNDAIETEDKAGDDKVDDDEETIVEGVNAARSVEAAAPAEVEEGTVTFQHDVNLRTFMEEQGEFTVIKVTQRSSLAGDMKRLRDALIKLEYYDEFKKSVFGHLHELSDKAIFPPRLVHGLRLRTITCKKKMELWVKFNGLPARFGMNEFAIMMGLSCHDYPSDLYLEDVKENGQSMWDVLIEKNGGKRAVSGGELLNIIEHSDLDSRTKYRLSLAWFAHSILCSKDLCTSIDPLFVCLASRPTTYFAKYPWGRKSFEMTIQSLVAPMNIEKKGYNLYGFPWAFVAWAYEAIPSLRHPGYDENPTEPRMLRWIPTKQERDCVQILRHVDNPVVIPILVPTQRESRKVFIKNLVPFVDEEDALIDELVARLIGAQRLRLGEVEVRNATKVVGYDAAVAGDRVIVPEQSERRRVPEQSDGRGNVADNVVGMSVDDRDREQVEFSGGRRRLFEFSGGEAGESTSKRHGCSSCKLCEVCKEEKESQQRLLMELKENMVFLRKCAEEKPKRTVYPSRARMSPYVASLKKSKKTTRARSAARARVAAVEVQERLPVDLYRPMDPTKEAGFLAYMKERNMEKRSFLGHEYKYRDFQDVIRMKKWMESQHVDEILNLMRIRHKNFHRHYNKTDVILDMNFCTKLTAAHQFFIKNAGELGISFDDCMKLKKYEEGLLDYASGKLPYPGGRKWDGAKRIFTILNIDKRHYLTCVFLLEQGKIELYDCNVGVYSEDALAPYVLPITIMFPKFLRDCGKFKHLPEAILNADLWGYERVKNLPRNETGTACGGYSLMFMEHLLTDTPMTLLHDSSMEDMRKKWAVDIFYEEMEP